MNEKDIKVEWYDSLAEFVLSVVPNVKDILEKYGGVLFPRFYENYDNGIDILGETWKETLNDYLIIFPGMDYQSDAKTAQQWTLLGDPSLKTGGYE